MIDAQNPFFEKYNTPHGTVPFDKIKTEHYEPAIREGIRQHIAEINAITDNPEVPTFDNTLLAYEKSGDLLNRVVTVFSNLRSAETNDDLQILAQKMMPLLSEHDNDISLNEKLFERIKTVYDRKEQLNLTAEQMKLLKGGHNFENDILMAAKNIGKRYAVNRPHVQNLEMTALAMFDATKKMHGMKERERLLLQMAVMLHDVGKYISFNNVADSSYNIIMSNEIIGLSHIEREMVALIARYNTVTLPSYDELVMESSLSAEQYLTVSELTAIVRLANALDRSHLQKIQAIRATLKERELQLSLTVNRDFTLEQGLCQEKLDFFNEVFSIQPVIKLKRQM